MWHAGPSSRKRKHQKVYVAYQKSNKNICDFCDFTEQSKQVVVAKNTHTIVDNIFGYDVWDDSDVIEHLMIVPRRHIISISEMNDDEKLEYMSTVSEYEKKGYSIYSRAPQNIRKSIVHQHTHLIRLSKTRKKIKLFLRKPHVLLYK